MGQAVSRDQTEGVRQQARTAAEDPARSGVRRGELRIYLGAAPGVGKTFAMLGEAHRRLERGTDVVIGLVEDHGRKRTADLAAGLETIPRKRIVHRDHEFTELDTGAVLARGPEVVVVDELAHTNATGSPNAKRWQDVEELLAAGIDVLSTVNVQHLASLNDVVARITGAVQRETVPDEVVRHAEQVELVDITPEALRRRLAHGNVYPAHRIDAALGNYFRLGNLTALRELALMWVADQVEVALQRYRSEQRITDTWETRERVVVAITGGNESETLIRRASRIAVRAGAELLVLHVLRGDGLAGLGSTATGQYRTLADDLGATFHTVVGERVPSALLDFARGVNATQVVVGTSRRSRLARLFREGIGATVVQDSGPIDVHIVTHEEAGGRLRTSLNRSPLAMRRKSLGWLLAVLAPAIATVVGAALPRQLDFSTNVLDFFLATVLVALVGGLGTAVFASVLSAGLLNFFFTEPRYTLVVDAPRDVVTLLVMVLVAVLVATVVDAAARRAAQAARARTEAALLASYARTVLTAPDPLPRLLEKVRENFGLGSVALLESDGDRWTMVGHAGTDPCAGPDEGDADIVVNPEVHLALRGRALPAADRRVLEGAAGQALLALRQQRMAEAAAVAERKAATTESRTALLSTVGHDLRTPLTSIKAAVGSLRAHDLELSEQDTEDLLATVEESTDRLTALVHNLLDSSRLATGAVRPHLQPVGYDEIVARALANTDGSARIVVEVSERLPAVLADAGLLERVIANVVDNGLRHGAPVPGRRADVDGDGLVSEDEPVLALRASAYRDLVELRVVDHGRGVPKGAHDSLFSPFQRLGDSASGVGLGLSVVQGLTEVMCGTVRTEDTPGGGLTVVIALPAQRADGAAG